MIDKKDKTMQLITAMAEVSVLIARLSPELKAIIRKKDSAAVVPDKCTIGEIVYTGEEGGITCKLDFGQENEKAEFWASLTHLIFDRRCPIYREITNYQKHRIKKLKKQGSKGY